MTYSMFCAKEALSILTNLRNPIMHISCSEIETVQTGLMSVEKQRGDSRQEIMLP